MSVLDRSVLEESPLADLHAIASELSIDGYRRLRRPDLITAILDKQSGGDGSAPAAEEDAPPARTRSSRPRRARGASARDADDGDSASAPTDEAADSAADADDDGATTRRRRGRRGGRGRSAAARDTDTAADAAADGEASAHADGDRADVGEKEKPARRRRRSAAEREQPREAERDSTGDDDDDAGQQIDGVVELLANGSGFARVDPPDPSDDDVYISAAQVKRCELVSGDRITGPKRAPRRSERFASLIRIETINGRPASELADSVRFDDLPAAMPSDRVKVGSEDPTLKAIEWLTPFGKGSRVTIVGAARSGKSEALRRLASALAEHDDLTLSVALAGVRPEEISEWARDPKLAIEPAAAVSFAASEDACNGVIEPVIDQARRLAARGADAVVLIDTLDGCSRTAARKAMASARDIVDGGSVTVIATASEPIGGETTVIALDVRQASTGHFPALDLLASGTIRPELLVGEAGAEAIARTRAEVADNENENEID